MEIAVNSGGAAAAPFAKDAHYLGGCRASSAAVIDTNGVEHAAPPAVYQTARRGSFTYAVSQQTPGTLCQIRLHFAELFHDRPGQRRFDVWINHTRVLGDFDILAEAGAKNKALVKTFIATADAAGKIVVQCVSGEADQPLVSGITVSPHRVLYRINCGGEARDGFSRDGHYSGGEADPAGIGDPRVYQSARQGRFTYAPPHLTPGTTYVVRLHFVEPHADHAGQRRFYVFLNGVPVLNDFDILAEAGAKNTAVVKEFVVVANHRGQIVLQYVPGACGQPRASAIEVLPPETESQEFLPGSTRASHPIAFPGLVKYPCDLLHKTVVEALSAAEHWTSQAGFGRGHVAEAASVSITVGLRDPAGWEFLCRHRAALVKAHYALWARLYEQTGGAPGAWTVVNLAQLCADLGYARHPRGGFQSASKREAVHLVQALAATEVALEVRPATRLYGPSKTDPQPLWFQGTLWNLCWEDDRQNLAGRPQPGTRFRYAPGPWFRDPDYRSRHQYIGKVSAGLLQLSNSVDPWALLIGGYLAPLARIGQYRPRVLRVGTILEHAGLAQSERSRRHAAEGREKLEHALERLREAAVLASWSFVGFDATEHDLRDPASLASYARHNPYPPGSWRDWRVKIVFPDALKQDERRLRRGRAKGTGWGNRP